MGRRLFSAVQHKNIIEALIENGVIVGDLVENWKQKAKRLAERDSWIKRGEAGDVEAMYLLGNSFDGGLERGLQLFKEDKQKAFEWFKKCHMAWLGMLQDLHDTDFIFSVD